MQTVQTLPVQMPHFVASDRESTLFANVPFIGINGLNDLNTALSANYPFGGLQDKMG